MRSRRPDSAAVPVPTHAGIAPGTAGVLTSAPRRCYWNPKVPRFTKMRQTMRPYLPQLTVPLRNRISSARLQPAPASRTPDPRFGDVPREPGEIGPTSRPGTEIAEAGARWRRAEIDVCVCNRAAQWCRLDLSLAAGWPTSAVLLLDALRGHADAAAGPCGERQSGSDCRLGDDAEVSVTHPKTPDVVPERHYPQETRPVGGCRFSLGPEAAGCSGALEGSQVLLSSRIDELDRVQSHHRFEDVDVLDDGNDHAVAVDPA